MTRTLIFSLALITAATASAEPMTVDEAVAIALQHNPNIRNAQLEVEKGGARVTAARTKRLPSLQFEAFGTESLNRLNITIKEGAFGTYPETGPIPNEDKRIDMPRTFSMFAVQRISQPITQLHKINLGVRLQEAALAADRENARAMRQSIAREVKSAYFGVLAAESALNATREAVLAHEEVLREMTVRVSQKAALEADRLDAAAKLGAIRSAELSAENTFATATQRLNYLLGRDLDSPMELAGATPQSLGSLRTATPVNRPDIKAAELGIEQARLDMRLKAAERIPDISLSVSHTTPINVDGLPNNMTSAALNISYEPFTWGRRGAELTEKRRAVEQAENSLRDKFLAAEMEISAKRRKVAEAAAGLQVRELESDAARERLRVVKARFIQKASRPEEMFAASASLMNSAAREQEAIAAFWTARADYDQAIGEE